MKIQLIRNSTLRIRYNGHVLLLDPFLAPAGALPPFAGIQTNPTVELPMSPEAVIADTELIMLTHLHPDHFDDEAAQLLPKFLPVLCAPIDQPAIENKGFNNTTTLTDSFEWNNIHFEPTPAEHGTGEWLQKMGHVIGFYLKAPNRPSLYIASDTVWYPAVEAFITEKQPDVIIANSGGAHFPDAPPIIMDIEQTIALCKAAPESKIVATHLESLDHCPVTRHGLRAAATEAGISESQLFIPEDGEILDFSPQ
ncbi:MBL fold metallo-hydrolase [Rubritalea spongiae]|uniref:MBL fold metallo-hydrolase n=1 Tax=Rubritalea spongiae TaxID=430797 RepID=A0ABW5E7T2_9BACT